MSENQNLFQNYDDAEQYIETVREHYRNEHGAYSGRRNEEQQLIAEVTADEARTIADGVLLGLYALSGNVDIEMTPELEENVQVGGYKWKDYRGEFERLLVGFGVITNRLNRDGFEVPSYADLRAEDRSKAASVLFSDFMRHNALRFGIETAGLHRSNVKRRHTEDGGIEVVSTIYDPDKARSDTEIERNVKKRGYTTDVAAHPALKISPEEYLRLRKEYPEIDKDDFDRDISFYINTRKEYENRE